jgi:hypothetical protein
MSQRFPIGISIPSISVNSIEDQLHQQDRNGGEPGRRRRATVPADGPPARRAF